MKYIQINAQSELPSLEYLSPFKCLVVVSENISQERQSEISNWLVKSGCFVMCAWGKNCSSWDDSVDFANIEQFNYEPIPPESFVLTTWHENESLEEVMFFIKHIAAHESHHLENVVLLNISSENRSAEFGLMYAKA